jgi:hypothetical protein
MPRLSKTSYFTSVIGRIILMMLVSLFTVPSYASAATDAEDLSVGIKTLPLLTNKITGTATLAIIFDPTNSASKDEASKIKAILDGGFEAPGDLKLIGILVPVSDLKRLEGSKIAVITSGLSAYFNSINHAAAANNILTISTDLNCVENNKCILGIISKPHVEIYFSKTAADEAQITFGQAFNMLVKQI